MDNVKSGNKKSVRHKAGPNRASQLTAATNVSGMTFPSANQYEKEPQTERVFEREYLIEKVEKLRKQNEILLDWNRKAQREKLDLRQLYEEQAILIERTQRSFAKENRRTGNRLISKEDAKAVECAGCAELGQQLTKKQALVECCRNELTEIKKQMAGYALVRKQQSAEEGQLKDKIIAKLEKELLDSRIEVLRLRDQLNESSNRKPETECQVRSQDLSVRLARIRNSIQENKVDLRPNGKEAQQPQQ